MTPNQQSAYSLLRENPDLPADKLAEKVGCSARQAANYRKAFKEGTLGTPKPSNLKPVPDLPKAKRPMAETTRLIDTVLSSVPVEPAKALEVTAPIVVPVETVSVVETITEPAETKLAGYVTALAGLALGIGFSVMANIAAAGDGFGAKATAASAPLAFFVAVEIVQRVRWPQGKTWWAAKWLGTGAVASVAAVVSYFHQKHLFISYKESELTASILPLAIDGLIVVSSAALIAMSKREKS